MGVSTTDHGTDLAAVRRLRNRWQIDHLDYLRGLRELSGSMTQVDLAKGLGLTQPSVNSALKSAAKIPAPRKGFSGASPYEIVQRYAAGELSRGAVIDELARWPYASRGKTDGYDWITAESDDGTWAEVEQALHEDLLDDETYDAILDRRDTLGL